MTNVETPEPTQDEERARRRWALVLASLGSFLVVLDMLVVVTALTAIQRDLGASIDELEWTVNGYTLTFAALLMTAAAIGERMGRRRVYAAGLALFAAASVGCALAPDVGWLIGARVVQGIGAATVMPLALGLLNAAFPPARRGWAMGVYGTVTGVAAVLGPVIGGAITQGLAWQWIFWVNVPIGVVLAGLVLAKASGSGGRRVPLDPAGLVLVTGCSVLLVWALVRGNIEGWSSPGVLASLLGGIVLAVAFVLWERRYAGAMLPMRLFGSRGFAAGNAAVFALNGSMAAGLFLMAQYQQVVAGLGPFEAGVRLLPWGVPPVLIALRSGSLADRWGARPLVVVGLALQAVGMGWLALAGSTGTGYAGTVVPMTLGGIGFALAIPAVTTAVVGAVRPTDIGIASGAFSTMRQLGGAFGVALAVAVFTGFGEDGSPAGFTAGTVAAFGALGLLSLLGGLAATALPRRSRPPVTAASVPGAPTPS
jgi:EmrB/QacA subfamily drug resistance transporter